jgi:hypothetical protein
MELPIELVKNIFNYLTNHPYKDVVHLVNGMLIAQQKDEATKQEEVSVDDAD